MMTLEGAWDWYLTVRKQLGLFARLGRAHWDRLPADCTVWGDDRLKEVGAKEIVEASALGLDHLDDFAVLVLFSVFESVVRDRALAEIRGERERLSHPLVIRIVESARDDIENGSFFRVLDAYKAKVDVNLVEEVDQVRRYRSWVAHGRRGAGPESVEPAIAYERLHRFLAELERSSPPTAGS